MENYKKGGYEKRFAIRKIVNHPDGRISTKATDPNADYFVLRLDKDPHAQKAIIAYAESVREDNRQFANDIEKKMTNEYGWEKADSDKGAEMKCEAGCKALTGGELRHHKDCVHYPESFSKMYDDLLASKPDKEWVSVEDRFPDVDEEVLIYYKAMTGNFYTTVAEYVNENRWRYLGGLGTVDATMYTDQTYIDIIKWRKLPNPPNN